MFDVPATAVGLELQLGVLLTQPFKVLHIGPAKSEAFDTRGSQ